MRIKISNYFSAVHLIGFLFPIHRTISLSDREEGDASECVDLPILFPINNNTEVSCGQIGALQESGGFNEGFDPCDVLIVLGSCCFCGGGKDASSVEPVLKSWRIVVYGHDVENQIELPKFDGIILSGKGLEFVCPETVGEITWYVGEGTTNLEGNADDVGEQSFSINATVSSSISAIVPSDIGTVSMTCTVVSDDSGGGDLEHSCTKSFTFNDESTLVVEGTWEGPIFGEDGRGSYEITSGSGCFTDASGTVRERLIGSLYHITITFD